MNSTAPARRRRRPGPPTAAVLLALALALLLVPSAQASQASQASEASQASAASAASSRSRGVPAQDKKATFGVQPAAPEKPDARPHFSYGVTGGAGLRDQIAVWNYGDEPLTLGLYASDAVNTADGGFDLLPAGRAPKDTGSWITLEKDKVTVPPKGNVIVPFTVRVPSDVTPGDHTGGIVASLAGSGQDDQGNKVRLDQRVGARVYVRAAGTLTPRLEVQDVSAAYEGAANPFGAGSATVTYTLRNTGNVRLGARQAVRINGMFGASVTATGPEDLGDLLPGSALTVTARADGVAPLLRSSAVVSVQPVRARDGVDPKLPSVTRSVALWTIPWTLLALILLAVAGGLWARRRKRLARAAATASARRGDTRGTHDSQNPQTAQKEPVVQFTRPARRTVAGLAAVSAAIAGFAAVAVAQPTAVRAAPAGTALVNPAAGTDTTSIDLAASAACPAPATHILVKVTGKGFPAEGKNVVGNSPLSTYGQAPSGGAVVPLTMTMRDYASEAGFTTLEGRYDLTVVCRKAFGSETYGDFTGSLWFTSNTVYQATDPAQPTPTPTGTQSPTPTPTATPTSTVTPTPMPTGTGSPAPTPSTSVSPSGTGGDSVGVSTVVPGGAAGTTGSSGGTGTGGGTGGGSATGGSGAKGSLSDTGVDAGLMALIAAALVVTGALAVWWARRRGLLTFAGN
ncbi:WxL protein peptidoglycan domain-containing protein [Streptomyces sp. NPDC058613]|uniref:WxL protein peptidoglycan domain-containing protein n=1 Tax=Streptomyces sp. NPDC058613 TaxID=3346556 RepID=UPI00365A1363